MTESTSPPGLCIKSAKSNCSTRTERIDKMKHGSERCNSELYRATQSVENEWEMGKNEMSVSASPPVLSIKNAKSNCSTNTERIDKMKHGSERYYSELYRATQSVENEWEMSKNEMSVSASPPVLCIKSAKSYCSTRAERIDEMKHGSERCDLGLHRATQNVENQQKMSKNEMN